MMAGIKAVEFWQGVMVLTEHRLYSTILGDTPEVGSINTKVRPSVETSDLTGKSASLWTHLNRHQCSSKSFTLFVMNDLAPESF